MGQHWWAYAPYLRGENSGCLLFEWQPDVGPYKDDGAGVDRWLAGVVRQESWAEGLAVPTGGGYPVSTVIALADDNHCHLVRVRRGENG